MEENGISIKNIIEKAVAGDSAAAGQLYEMHRSKGISIAMQYVKNRDDAEDMYQDSFLKALTNIDKFDTSKQFAPWLDTIIVNTCKNFLVKKKAVNFSEMSDEESEFVDTLDSKDNETMPELSYDRKEFMEIMDGLINELPQAQREAVTLFYYKEMSVKQIAEYQDVPEDTVKSRLNYSRKKVGAAVEEYEKKTGTKLHGALIVPFMYLLFYKKSVHAAEAESLLSAASSVAGNAAWSSTSTAPHGMTHAAATGVTKTGMSLALKIGIPVIAAAVIGTTAYTVINLNNDDKVTETADSDKENTSDESEETDVEFSHDEETISESTEEETVDDEQTELDQEEEQGKTTFERDDFTDELIDSINERGKEDLRRDFYDFFTKDQNNTTGIVGGPTSCDRGVSGEITGEPELLRVEISGDNSQNSMLLYYEIPATTHFLDLYDDYSEEPVYMALIYRSVSLLNSGDLDFGEYDRSFIADKPELMSNFMDGYDRSSLAITVDKANREIDEKLVNYFKNGDYKQGTPYALYDINGDGQHELIIRGGEAEELYPYIVEVVSVQNGELKSTSIPNSGDYFKPHNFIQSYINTNDQILFACYDIDPEWINPESAYYIVNAIDLDGDLEKVVEYEDDIPGTMSDMDKEYCFRSRMILWENEHYSTAG